MFDTIAFSDFLTDACAHYEQSAPTVETWADGLYRRIGEDPATVVLSEILFAQRLRDNGEWMDPHHAANGVLHLMDRIGQATTGMMDH